MPNPTMRVSLPGYDAGTDTNLDHFALYADQDNVLIKEYTRGAATIGASGTQTISHNFGYVPMFLVYAYDAFLTNNWELIPHIEARQSLPPYQAYSDTNTLSIVNNSAQSAQFKWYVFYDNFTGNAGTFTQSKQAIKIAKSGVDAGTATDPNLFLFHSDLNTFKVISEGTTSLSFTSGTAGGTYTFNHSAGLGSASSYAVFMKFPDGYSTMLPGKGQVFSYDNKYNVHDTYINATQIGMTITGTGNATLPVKYYVFETPLGTP